MLAQFPRGQRALIAGAGFIHPNMHRDPGIMRMIDGAGGRAPIYGGQPSGVAMGHDVDRCAISFVCCDLSDQIEPVDPDLAIDLDIFVSNLFGQHLGRFGPVCWIDWLQK